MQSRPLALSTRPLSISASTTQQSTLATKQKVFFSERNPQNHSQNNHRKFHAPFMHFSCLPPSLSPYPLPRLIKIEQKAVGFLAEDNSATFAHARRSSIFVLVDNKVGVRSGWICHHYSFSIRFIYLKQDLWGEGARWIEGMVDAAGLKDGWGKMGLDDGVAGPG